MRKMWFLRKTYSIYLVFLKKSKFSRISLSQKNTQKKVCVERIGLAMIYLIYLSEWVSEYILQGSRPPSRLFHSSHPRTSYSGDTVGNPEAKALGKSLCRKNRPRDDLFDLFIWVEFFARVPAAEPTVPLVTPSHIVLGRYCWEPRSKSFGKKFV